jgi:hypothetical protein
LLAIFLASCESKPESLQLDDLNRAEFQYVERFVTLERARAVALVDAPLGSALLDSLATTWGDSALAETRRDLPQEPHRIAAVHDLLLRILDAERDSLVKTPAVARLKAPLPDPTPTGKEP